MDDRRIVDEINKPVADEHRLGRAHTGAGLSSEETAQLRSVHATEAATGAAIF